MSIEQKAADEFDRWQAQGRGESMARGHRPVVEPVLDGWGLGPDSRVLDVGCGNGWAVRWMLERGAGAGHGVDISPSMVQEASQGPGTFAVASGERLPFDDGAFTHVLSVESLYYYPSPALALKEWARVTAPGGHLGCVIELFAENTGSAIWADVLDVHAHLLSEKEYLRLAEEAGWDARIERIRRHGSPKPEAEFTPSKYWPRYDLYVEYFKQGALAITGTRRPS